MTRSEIITEAARWLLRQPKSPSPVVPAIRKEFPLTAAEAVEAIREASLIRGRAN